MRSRLLDARSTTFGSFSFRRGALVVCAVVLLVQAGCSSTVSLMPTPNIYASGERDPFPDVPPELQNNRVEVVYLTDRAPEEGSTPDKPIYGSGRSRSTAMGIAEVHFGKDVSWEQLNKASRSAKRDVDLPMTVAKTTEIVRFPPTPNALVKVLDGKPVDVVDDDDGDDDEPGNAAPTAPTTRAAPTTRTAEQRLSDELGDALPRARAQLSAQLAKSPVKEVFLFVHGYANTFDDSLMTIAELWHFMGRRGVPVAYSWPAGRGGLLRGYTYDRESSEFTVYHLKQVLRLIAGCPDVQKINIISHSRGTDVAMGALRELHLEIASGARRTGGAMMTRKALKLGVVVMAAPDLDIEVVIQRTVTARMGRVPEQLAMYVCSNDKALGISNWLFGGRGRLGKITPDLFSPEELTALRQAKTVQIIDCQIKNFASFGHDYFHSSPGVSSDLILLMRYKLAPGERNGRPLAGPGDGFWDADDKYPEKAPTAPTTPPQPQTARASQGN